MISKINSECKLQTYSFEPSELPAFFLRQDHVLGNDTSFFHHFHALICTLIRIIFNISRASISCDQNLIIQDYPVHIVQLICFISKRYSFYYEIESAHPLPYFERSCQKYLNSTVQIQRQHQKKKSVVHLFKQVWHSHNFLFA